MPKFKDPFLLWLAERGNAEAVVYEDTRIEKEAPVIHKETLQESIISGPDDTFKMIEMKTDERGNSLWCPHCNGEIQIDIRIGLSDVYILGKKEEALASLWKRDLDSQAIVAVEEAKTSGLLSTFAEVVSHTLKDMPKSIERFFLTFLRRAEPTQASQRILNMYAKEFGAESEVIQIVSHQSVAAVLCRGDIKLFIPLNEVSSLRVRESSREKGSKGMIRTFDEEKIEEMIRTKFGYVMGRNEAFENLQRRSIGEFARPTL